MSKLIVLKIVNMFVVGIIKLFTATEFHQRSKQKSEIKAVVSEVGSCEKQHFDTG